MSSDRSTLQRGQPGGPEQPPVWPEPTAPAGRRLPSAPRERKPALAALAALLIVGSALGTGLLVISSGKRVTAIEITREVGQGQRIPVSAMTQVQIASTSGLDYVPFAQASQVSHFFAAGSIPPGTLLTRQMVSSASTSISGKTLVGLTLKSDQVPAELVIGDRVDVYETSDQVVACPGPPGTILDQNAVVTQISSPSASTGNEGSVNVDLAVSPPEAGAVACAAANSIAGIGVVPANGAAGQPAGPPALGNGTGASGTTSTSTVPTPPPATSPPARRRAAPPKTSPSSGTP
jgi:hypothetical protein